MDHFENITPDHPLLLMGGGRMGAAMLKGWLSGPLGADRVMVVEPVEPVMDALAAQYPGLAVHPSLEGLTIDPSVVVLAVKPQVMEDVLPALTGFAGALFISIAAGRTLASFAAVLGDQTAVVRAMPNTPAAIGHGMTACVAGAQVGDVQRALCTGLLEAVGDVAWIDDEALMDAVTAVSGSGPAYIFHLVEAMAAAGETLGLPPDLADRLARRTVAGAGALLDQSPEAASVLRQNVTSRGGTTQAALDVLMADNGLARLMRAATDAAARRSKELSG